MQVYKSAFHSFCLLLLPPRGCPLLQHGFFMGWSPSQKFCSSMDFLEVTVNTCSIAWTTSYFCFSALGIPSAISHSFCFSLLLLTCFLLLLFCRCCWFYFNFLLILFSQPLPTWMTASAVSCSRVRHNLLCLPQGHALASPHQNLVI